MKRAFLTFLCGVCACGWLAALPGCNKDRHDKVQMREEQHEGEVRERETGEMIVE